MRKNFGGPLRRAVTPEPSRRCDYNEPSRPRTARSSSKVTVRSTSSRPGIGYGPRELRAEEHALTIVGLAAGHGPRGRVCRVDARRGESGRVSHRAGWVAGGTRDARRLSPDRRVSTGFDNRAEIEGQKDPFRIQRNEAGAAGANLLLVKSRVLVGRRNMDCPGSSPITDCPPDSGAWFRLIFASYTCAPDTLRLLTVPVGTMP
jgi:hypothetical protein